MSKVKNTLIKVKNHVKEKKSAYVWAGIAISVIALQQRNLRTFRSFLDEKGIDQMEFFNPEYYEELKGGA